MPLKIGVAKRDHLKKEHAAVVAAGLVPETCALDGYLLRAYSDMSEVPCKHCEVDREVCGSEIVYVP